MSDKRLDYKDIIEHWIRDPDIGTFTSSDKGRSYYRVEPSSYVDAFSALFNTLKAQGYTLEEIQSNSGGIIAALQQSLTPSKWEKLKEWRESIRGVWVFIVKDAMVKENPITISKPDSGVVERYKEARTQEKQEKKVTAPKAQPKPIAKETAKKYNDEWDDNENLTSTIVERPEIDRSKLPFPKPTTVIDMDMLLREIGEDDE
jgi:hypothetical protein